MKTSIKSSRNSAGFTLAEVLIASSLFSIMTAALFALSLSVQKTFRGCSTQMRSQAEQIRILDHMALDLRRAVAVTAAPTRLLVKIPNYYDGAGKPKDPILRNGRVEYDATNSTIDISYYKQGSAIYRESAGRREMIGSDVEDFDINIADVGRSVNVALSFQPRFHFSNSPRGYREGTSTYTTTLLRNRRL
jgi:prepilin-type N-terminal cleavage/methylation domain-containing protein